MNNQQRFLKLYSEFTEVCATLGVTDPFNYNRARELHTSILLGHRISPTLDGPDAFYNDLPVEYKSTIGKKIQATYNGIAVLPTWEEQEVYLRNEKIGKYPYHFWTRYEGSTLVECIRFTADQILDEILPKLKKQYESCARKKDPRLGITIGCKEFINRGIRIIF